MNKTFRTSAALLVPAIAVALLAATPAFAQDKKAQAVSATRVVKEIDQNDKFHVYEVTYKPGAGSPSAVRSARVVHAITSGKLERTFDDGTKTTSEWKAGETKIIAETKPYAVKNIGKTTARLLVIESK
jgi:mannose-6-phosphate isomerase-like protein (cupin superfamily)